jgi:hypothetical protein
MIVGSLFHGKWWLNKKVEVQKSQALAFHRDKEAFDVSKGTPNAYTTMIGGSY